MDICTEHFNADLFILFQQRSTRKADKYSIRHDCLHRRMELTGLCSVAFVNKYHKISLCLEISREGGFQLFNILIVVIFCRFSATTAKLMHQRADQRIIIYIQAIQQILTALGTSNILIHASECFFYLLIKLISVCHNKDTGIKFRPMCQNPLGKPYHCQRFAGTLRMPKNTAHRFIRISVRIVKLRPQIIKPLLSALDAKILIVPAHFFDAFIKNNKVHDKVDEALLVEHGIYLLQELVLNPCTGFADTDINRITLVLVLLEAVVFPLHVELLAGQECTVAQAFRLIPGHAELHGSKETSNERVLLVCEILPDALRHRDAASLQFNDSHGDTVQVDNEIGPLFLLLDNCYFLGDCKVIIQRIGLIDQLHRNRRLFRALADRDAILQPRIHSLIGIIDST